MIHEIYGLCTGALCCIQIFTGVVPWPKGGLCRPENANAWGASVDIKKSIPIFLSAIIVGGIPCAYLFRLSVSSPFPLIASLVAWSLPHAFILLFLLRDIANYIFKGKRQFAYGMPFGNSFLESMLEANLDGNLPIISVLLGLGVGVIATLLYYISKI